MHKCLSPSGHCKKWECPRCGKRLRKLWTKKLKGSFFDKAISLTADPSKGTPEEMEIIMQRHFRKMKHAIRKMHGRFEFVWVLGWQESSYPHYHLLAWGDKIPFEWLKEFWSKKVAVQVRIESTPLGSKRHINYLLDNLPGGESYHPPPDDYPRRLIGCSKEFFKPKIIEGKVKEIPISLTVKLVLKLKTINGKEYFDFRKHCFSPTLGKYVPTKKGIWMNKMTFQTIVLPELNLFFR